MQTFNYNAYTADLPRKSGFYWILDMGHPVPQVRFLMYLPGDSWRMYGSGAYAEGLPWTKGNFRSIEPLKEPQAYVEKKQDNDFVLTGRL